MWKYLLPQLDDIGDNMASNRKLMECMVPDASPGGSREGEQGKRMMVGADLQAEENGNLGGKI